MTEYAGKENLDFLEKVPNYMDVIEGLITTFLGNETTVLDFGAGSGIYARRLAAKNINVSCIEIDPEYAGALTAQNFQTYKSFAEMPEQYPRIYSCDVIEHIEDDAAILSQLRAKLADNGKIFIYVPAFQVLYSEMDRRIGHYRRYTKRGLVEKMEQAGFKIISAGYVDSIGFFGKLFNKHFGSKDGSIGSGPVYKYYKYIFPISRLLDKCGAKFLLGKNLLVIAGK